MVVGLQTWEWVAVAAAVAGGLLERLTRTARTRGLARLRASPRLAPVLAQVLARPASAFSLFFKRFGPDAALLALVFVTTLPALRMLWSALGAYGSPMGPDADENYLAAIALERNLPALYARDRYPAFAALVSLVASGPLDVHLAAVRVSIACALVGAVVAYVLGRQLGGRAAAVVGSAIYLRLPGIVDVSRQFTPYMLVALLDLVAVCLVVGGVRGRRVGVPLAGVLTGLWAADPKQMPGVLAFAAVGIGLSLAQRSWVGLAGAIALAAAIPTANYAASSLKVRIFSVEEIAGRVDLGLRAPAVPTGSSGYRLGGDLRALPATLERLAATEPRVGRGWLHDRVGTSLPMELPRTSLVWLVIAGIGCFSLRCGWRRALATPLAILPLAPLALATLHLHFQHRYFASLAAPAPALVASGVALLGGPGAVVGAGLVALYWPTSPWSVVGPGLLDATPYNAEPWAGREPPDWTDALARAVESLPPGASVADYSQSRPWTLLAAAFDYHRCTHTRDTCRSLVTTPGAPLAAILIAGEGVSVTAPGARSLAGQSAEPETIGTCWTLAFDRPGPGAAYVWTCPERPGL